MQGSNDLPTIASATSLGLVESDAGLSGSGTLLIGDDDLSNSVTAAVQGVVVSGVSAGLATSANAALKAMLTVEPITVITAGVSTGTRSLHLHSGTEAFKYLAEGVSPTPYSTILLPAHPGSSQGRFLTLDVPRAPD